jgi:tryptophan synthase beta chain
MEAEVWQVGSSFDQKPYRRLMMELYGSKVEISIAYAACFEGVIRVAGPQITFKCHRLWQGCAGH